jgi:hypothetical protein
MGMGIGEVIYGEKGGELLRDFPPRKDWDLENRDVCD